MPSSPTTPSRTTGSGSGSASSPTPVRRGCRLPRRLGERRRPPRARRRHASQAGASTRPTPPPRKLSASAASARSILSATPIGIAGVAVAASTSRTAARSARLSPQGSQIARCSRTCKAVAASRSPRPVRPRAPDHSANHTSRSSAPFADETRDRSDRFRRCERIGASFARPRAHRLFTVPLGTRGPGPRRPRSTPPCPRARARPAARPELGECGHHVRTPLADLRRILSGLEGRSAARSSSSGSASVGRSSPPHPVEAGVDHDPVQPRGHRALPRKVSARRNAEMQPSCTASDASSRSPIVRSATAHSRSLCRLTISLKACGSPAMCRVSRSASDTRARAACCSAAGGV